MYTCICIYIYICVCVCVCRYFFSTSVRPGPLCIIVVESGRLGTPWPLKKTGLSGLGYVYYCDERRPSARALEEHCLLEDRAELWMTAVAIGDPHSYSCCYAEIWRELFQPIPITGRHGQTNSGLRQHQKGIEINRDWQVSTIIHQALQRTI